jgi:chromate transporter
MAEELAEGAAGAARREPLLPIGEATRAWFAISLQTFGGPAGQIAVMHRKLVDELRWVSERRFLHALNYCMLLPGPEAQQLAIYLGWLLNGWVGGFIAGSLFVLPGFIALMALSAIYAGFGDTLGVEALFAGVAPAVLAIVASAVLRVAGRSLRNGLLIGLAVASFLALALFRVPFPLVVLAAGLVGFVGGRVRPTLFAGGGHASEDPDAPPPLISDDVLHHERPSWGRAARILAGGLVVWALPVVVLALVFGGSSTFVDQGTFFSGTAVVTFGGAYAVLAYIAQRAVYTYGWLAPGEMVRGLAMAETTPGPLIQVVQFVAFMGAYRDPPGSLDPWVAAVIAAFLVTWVTYVPCFLWIYLGAPSVEALRGNQQLSSALTAITAAVVGVIANLAVFFAVHTLFGSVDDGRHYGPLRIDVPDWSSISPRALAVGALAFVLMFGRKWSVLPTLGACAVVGGGIHLLAAA